MIFDFGQKNFWINSQKIALLALTLLPLSSCAWINPTGLEIKISSIPKGYSNLKSGEVITFWDSKRLRSESQKVNFFINENPEANALSNPEIVVASFDDQIKLIDFYVPEINENPDLSFYSTARALVFINPLFLGLPPENKKSVFQKITEDEDFAELVILLSNSTSILEDSIVDLATQIAIRVAENQGLLVGEQQAITPNSSTAPSPLEDVSKKSENLFKTQDFPKESCGDNLPVNSEAYPLNFYPVFVDYTEANLQKIKSNFCEDSYQLRRESTGNLSIQVASFTSLESAESFKVFINKFFNGAEIGEPRLIEAPPNSYNKKRGEEKLFSLKKLIATPLNTLIPPVQAQNLQPESSWLEYSLNNQFSNDGLFPGTQWPRWHGLELKVESSGIKIVGTSLLAQQVLVYPAHKDWTQEGVVVSKKIIYPANLGTWDGNTIKTLSGQNNVEIPLTPENGQSWAEGTYNVLISGGYALRPRTGFDINTLQAFDINMLLLITDSLTMFSGLGSDELFKEIVDTTKDFSQLGVSCRITLESKKDKSSILSIYNALAECLTGPENLKILANLLFRAVPELAASDLTTNKNGKLTFDERLVTKLISPLLTFQGLSVEAVKSRGKDFAQQIDFFERLVALNRIWILGLYLQHENEEGLYYGSFTVSQITESYPSRTKTLPSASRDMELDCSPNTSVRKRYQELDVIIEVSCYSSNQGGISAITVTNYSNNAVEVHFPIPGVLPDLLLPNSKSSIYRATVPWEARDNWKNRPDGVKIDALNNFNLIETFVPYKLPLSLKSYSSRNLVKEVRVQCSDKPTRIWGVQIEPQCVPPGLRATYKNMTHKPIKIGVLGLNEPPVNLSARWDTHGLRGGTGGSGNVQWSSDTVTLSIIIDY
ncbi:hypothetical protein [Oscillatoria sp. HE19RPO]|uniref:hypothetical protein n=1 Tax=Oscillatoria sp. HE19RPO TaxID=2954806 RepID=UPI0020C2079D|nr:hypothetical protein [Oscillatoria sp. HE19RPO]